MSAPRLYLLGDENLSCELPESGMLVVGHSAERAGFVVQGQGIEDAHFAIGRAKSGGWAIKDLGSEYGTLLNGERVTSARLRPGDKLLAGSRRFEVRDGDAAQPAPKKEEQKPSPKPVAVEAEPKQDALSQSQRPQDLPERIGGYRIDRLLGRGGAGKVYLALQESLNRPVALKILAPKYSADRTFIARFQSEARAAAALSHSNVVVVHDVGEADGQHYLSMEFMPGGSLEQRLAAAGPLPWRQVLDMLADASAGLMFAESRGICHRDIKPANLMLTGTGTVKIADLGLATSTEVDAEEVISDGKKIVGTPHFMSPEQARGERVDHRSDLYSLGATAYRLLSGHTPFEGATTRDILRALLTDEPVPLREFVEGLPQDLDALIARLLSKSAEDRFPSAEALRLEIDKLRLAADHGEAFPSEALQKARRTRRRGLILGALILVASTTTVGYLYLAPLLKSKTGGNDPNDSAALPTVVTPLDLDDDDVFFTEPAPGGPGAPGSISEIDEEAQLRLIEADAMFALNDLPKDLTRPERIAALEAFLLEHTGAPRTSGEARDELEVLQGQVRAQEARDSRWIGVLEQSKSAWRTAAAWPPAEGTLPDPAGSLAGLRSLPAPTEYAADPRFVEARKEFQALLLSSAEETLRAELETLLALEQAGAFDELRTRLADLATRFDFADPQADDPPELEKLRSMGADVQTRLTDLDAAEARWRLARDHRRAKTVALTLGRGSGFAAELRGLSLDAIEERITQVEASLGGDPTPELYQLRRDYEHILIVISNLVDELAGDAWRRRAIPNPSGRGATQKVIGLSRTGISFERSDGELSWAQLRTDPSWFAQLFNDRLKRDYSAEEKRGILAVLRWTGTAQAVARAVNFLSANSAATLREQDEEAIRNGVQDARNWWNKNAQDLEEEGRLLLRGERALELIAGSIRAAQEQSYALSVARLEQLIFELDDTLVVLLLSDGRAVEPAPPVVPSSSNTPKDEQKEDGASDSKDDDDLNDG